jgi:hypothetical protein
MQDEDVCAGVEKKPDLAGFSSVSTGSIAECG